jgi:hypothetical protein
MTLITMLRTRHLIHRKRRPQKQQMQQQTLRPQPMRLQKLSKKVILANFLKD